MTEQEQKNNEINLFELCGKLCRDWKIVAGCLLLGIAIAAAYYMWLPKKYEAGLLIQVARIGKTGHIEKQEVPVEQPELTAQRITTPGFQHRVAVELNDTEALDAIARSTWGSYNILSVKIIKTSGPIPLVEVRAYGDTPEVAKRKLEVTLSHLAKVHAELARPTLIRLNADLANQRTSLKAAEDNLVAINNSIKNGISGDRLSQLALMESLRVQKETDLLQQRKAVSELERALVSPATQPTQAFEPIFASSVPVSPHKLLILAMGGIGGLLVAVLWIFISTEYLKRKK